MEDPIAFAASITPESTSLSEDSTILATNGAAATTSGTTVAVEPIVVPTISLVNGSIATSRMRKGTERITLVINPTIRFTALFGFIPFGLVTFRITPTGIPIKYAKAVERITI